MDDDQAPVPTFATDVETEVRGIVGLFDVPAFARRGQDLEHALARLDESWRGERLRMLEMVHMRLRQWERHAGGPQAWVGVFQEPLDALYQSSLAPSPAWSPRPGSPRARRALARDLIASVDRFNERWRQRLEALNLDVINDLVDQYNRYYLLEKECVMGSPRLAARLFQPVEHVAREPFIQKHPLLPRPELACREPGRRT